MDAENTQQIVQFGLMVLEELRKGNSAASSGDLHLKRLSVNKLTFHSSILSRIMEVTINEELKVELTRLITCTSQFLESNRITGYSMVETAPVGPGLLATIPPSISGGRPEYVLPMGYINNCRKAGMTLAAIARDIQISRTTLYKHKHLILENEEISDDELSATVAHLKEENPMCGEKYVTGHLRATGKKATQLNIRRTLRSLDPVGTCFRQRLKTKRTSFFVPGPNHMWSLDGNEKLKMYGVWIHGCVDTYSRKLLYVLCATNKKSHTVYDVFKRCVNTFGFPARVRSDKGRESKKVATFMVRNRGVDSNCYITGKSVHNVRIERLWGEINKITLRYKTLLHNLQLSGFLNENNPRHRQAVAYVYIPRIQRSLDEFQSYWNCHSIRTVEGDCKTPDALYLTRSSVEVSLVNRESIDDSESDNDYPESDTDDSDCDNGIDYRDPSFREFARSVIPDPLIEDGSNGEQSLMLLLNALL